MSQAPMLSRFQFERSIEAHIARADAQRRSADLDRVVAHVLAGRGELGRLGSLMMLLDEDVRQPVKADVDAWRRLESTKGRTVTDDEVFEALLTVYNRTRRGC